MPAPASLEPLPGRRVLRTPLPKVSPTGPPKPSLAPTTDVPTSLETAALPYDTSDVDYDVIEEQAPEKASQGARSDTGTLLLLSATVSGVLAVALALIGTSPMVLTARLVIACVGAAFLVVRAVLIPKPPTDPHPAALLTPMLCAATVAIWARITKDAVADEAAVMTGLIVVSFGTTTQLVEQVRRDATMSLQRILDLLEAPARRVVSTGYAIVSSSTLRPGEEILIDASETVPADVVVSAGEATVLPWLDARTATRKAPGDSLVAGAKLVSGRLRATVTWTGMDRAWLRTSADPSRAAHVVAPIARTARHVVERWAILAASVAALAATVNGGRPAAIILSAVAAHVAIASIGTGAMPSLHVLRGILEALGRGVVYQSAAAWEKAAHATQMVFCARGTLLLGEPQVAEIIPIGSGTAERLLALASGAEMAVSDSIALAVHQAARARKIRADAVRSPTIVPGLGVTAVTSSGESLCVGSRVLLLREHISVASIEAKLAELEAHGRTVLVIAVAGKLVGIVALQDGLRPGARASVQFLHDAGIEPVLLSGDARETCEAIARSLDIEHVRPEVLPADRAHEVKRLEESGAIVAVVGRPNQDDLTLDAADVAVALESAGSSRGDWGITLAGDDIRDAARSAVSARRTRAHARTALALGLAPGIAAALAIAFGLLPPAYSPLAVLIGGIASHLHARASSSSEH